MFDINYIKNKKDPEFKTLDDITKIQNYIPIYNKFFALNDTNFNHINLNNRYHIQNCIKKQNYNAFNIKVKSDTQEQKVHSFFKYSPLVDPVKYMAGKYTKYDIRTLPSFSNSGYKKLRDPNNSAYIDSFFSFLSSKTLNAHRFYHGIDFYGSFLGIKKNFVYNIADDIEYLHQSEFFHKNKQALFVVDDSYTDILCEIQSRNFKKKLNIGQSLQSFKIDDLSGNIIQKNNNIPLTVGPPIDHNDIIFDISAETVVRNLIFTSDSSNNSLSTKSSGCSSRSSHTSCTSQSLDSYSSFSTDSEVVLAATLFDFPVQVICLEALEATLDSIMDELSIEEWRSALFQVIMTLLVYQKLFDFTHNDLHTNNIMFNNTEKKFLYYRYNNKFYKVPTFGKIFKIIDFGRSIYKYKGTRICSDSFHMDGDAATQYNCEPYFNEQKPRLEPNKSFDLCRLGCSLFDFFFEDVEDEKNIKDPIMKLVNEWCQDDKKRNILYKKNGEERYPDFKLYKMIARTVHHCIPSEVIQNSMFNKYIVTKKKIKKKTRILNIDTLPVYS